MNTLYLTYRGVIDSLLSRVDGRRGQQEVQLNELSWLERWTNSPGPTPAEHVSHRQARISYQEGEWQMTLLQAKPDEWVYRTVWDEAKVNIHELLLVANQWCRDEVRSDMEAWVRDWTKGESLEEGGDCRQINLITHRPNKKTSEMYYHLTASMCHPTFSSGSLYEFYSHYSELEYYPQGEGPIKLYSDFKEWWENTWLKAPHQVLSIQEPPFYALGRKK